MREFLKRYFERKNQKYIEGHGLITIEGSKNLWFFLDIMEYKGKAIELEDGTIVKKGDIIAEIHLNNDVIIDNLGNVKFVFNCLQEECSALAVQIPENEQYQKIVAYFARTLMYPFAAKKGFEVREVKNRFLALFIGFWDSTLKYALEKNKTKFKIRKPKEIWISREKIMKLYSKDNLNK
ncbi:MAG: hypothetical protein K0R15_1242 [Clostridiales bacterium]|jgi:hypothetical protein|nr:hypothetical protein [Clostridiales bacterium]